MHEHCRKQDVFRRHPGMFGLNSTSECVFSWISISHTCSHGSKWLSGRPLKSRFHQCRLSHTWLLFQFLSVDLQIHILNASEKKTHTQIRTCIHTTWVVAGRRSASHPVVSLHASKLFSVTQILIWKSQLTELTETREKDSADSLSSFCCPFLLASSPSDW